MYETLCPWLLIEKESAGATAMITLLIKSRVAFHGMIHFTEYCRAIMVEKGEERIWLIYEA